MTIRFWLFALTLLTMLSGGCAQRPDDGLERVTINGQEFALEVAANDATRQRGLAGRESIDEHGGMLFLFPEPMLLSFHMKDCLTDIDIIFVDARGRITALHEMKAEPPRRPDETENAYLSRLRNYTSGSRALAAIELRAGWIDKLSLSVQDQIELDVERLKANAESTDLAR